LYGNGTEFGNVGESFGKRCLFFLTAPYPEMKRELKVPEIEPMEPLGSSVGCYTLR
jgi:hypothetical protein